MLDEPVEMNFVRKHYLNDKPKLGDSSLARIFGPSPTEYATSMRTRLELGNWQEEAELVKSYDDSMSYAYINGSIERSEDAFKQMFNRLDLISQERDNSEYEITDLDHYYEFVGGLARSVQEKRGEKPTVMIVDTTEEDIVVEDIQISIERATRTRILNPKWLDGMLKHDFHGAQQVKTRVENLIGLAATTGKVGSWVFDSVADRLIFNQEMRRKLEENNRFATVKIGELLIESERRGYWKADESRSKQLRELVLKLEGQLE
jgi:cobaltochelatase CobN